MTADISTRRGAKISDILGNIIWINGHKWAKYNRDIFPIKSVRYIKLRKMSRITMKLLNWTPSILTGLTSSY